MKNEKKILIISSANPLVGPGYLATDLLNAFTMHGCETDVLTLKKIDNHPEYLYVQDHNTFSYKFKEKIKFYKERLGRVYYRIVQKKKYPFGDYHFFYKNEENPPVPASEVLSKIKKQYDFVILLFWQGMLSFDTVNLIYNKLEVPIYFYCVDYSPMSGGCHFTGDCEHYKTGCGCCPAFESKDPNDFTHRNILYRKQFYKRVNPIVSGNSYMHRFFSESYLLRDTYNTYSFPIIDTEKFCPKEKSEAKKSFNVSFDRSFLILFGSQNIHDERKGIKYMVEALNLFSKKLTEEERSKVLLVVIGRDFYKIKNLIDNRLSHLELGFVTMDFLPNVYSMSDVFLCSSINDAGPMMVNQSLCCGTPVVGFEMGTCLDCVKDKGTGYCAKLRDSEDFANGIYSIFKLSDKEKKEMSNRCRVLAVETYSYKVTVDRFLQQFAEYQNTNR